MTSMCMQVVLTGVYVVFINSAILPYPLHVSQGGSFEVWIRPVRNESDYITTIVMMILYSHWSVRNSGYLDCQVL